MIYKVGMLCKHFKGSSLLDKNVYRIEKLNVDGKDINENEITYTGDGNLKTATNLVVYSNVFQDGKMFCREYEDISGELPLEKREGQLRKVEPLSEDEINLVQDKDFIILKKKRVLEKFKKQEADSNSFKRLRDYTHEELMDLMETLDEKQILELSANYGGYPVLFRMSLDPRVSHMPFIQPGSAIIIRNPNGEILLQERTDRNLWGLPGGCQDLGERLEVTAAREALEETGIVLNPDDLILIASLSGEERRNSYPNGDIVFNNTDLFLADVDIADASSLKGDSETKRLRFFNPEEVPENLMDKDLITRYLKYVSNRSR